MSETKQTTDVAPLREAAHWLRVVSEKCCECTDGHHDQMPAYGTEADVHISRDTARALADWLDADAGVIERRDLDVSVSMAYVVASGLLAGTPEPRTTPYPPVMPALDDSAREPESDGREGGAA